MMTLDEAIEHCKQKALAQASCSNIKCSNEHKQLAQWLKELKVYIKKYGPLEEGRTIQDRVDAEYNAREAYYKAMEKQMEGE